MSRILQVNEYTKTMHSEHYYDSMPYIEKRNMYPAVSVWADIAD